ncbi:MAG: TldD/PmbA family protein [Candidatus Thorarchaeota archaeon]|jgi:PmbA protein
MNVEVLNIAEKAVKEAERLGADQVEVYSAISRSFTIEVENSAIRAALEKRDSGCGIRTVVGKKIGFAYVTTIAEDDVMDAVKSSVALAKASLPDKDFESLPSFDGKYPSVKGLFHQEIGSLNSEEAANLVLRTVDASKQVVTGKQIAVEAQISTSAISRAVVNSLNIEQKSESTNIFLYCDPKIKDGQDQTASYEYQLSRNLKDIDPEWVGETAATNALETLGAMKVEEDGDYPVILTPLTVGTIIGGGFAGAVNAEEVQYGRSYIADDFGSKIGTDEFEITDDALIEGGIGSRSFDAEGYPTQRTEILVSGVLRNLLHNSYTAYKDGVDNTGNASRPSYSGLPSISTSNFVIKEGRGTLDDLVSEIKKGILCRNTGDRPNMTTGDLSAMVMEGFFIEGGEIKHPVKNTLIGINMRDLLQRIHRIGGDTRSVSSVISPSLVIDSARITSG